MKIHIPFRIVELEKASFHPLVQGEIDGNTINLIIDTGASRTVFDKQLLNGYPTISVDGEEPLAAGINAETMAVEQVNLPLIKLGDVEFNELIVFGTDLEGISSLYQKMVGISIHGLLGCDFLEHHKAVLDFSKKRITFNKKVENNMQKA